MDAVQLLALLKATRNGACFVSISFIFLIREAFSPTVCWMHPVLRSLHHDGGGIIDSHFFRRGHGSHGAWHDGRRLEIQDGG
jgi:hypothetical protein